MTRREPARALLVDLDGVLRRWDPAVTAAVEQRYGVAPGTVLETLFEWPRLVAATTGQISDAEWHEQTARALADRLGGDAVTARSLIEEWQAYRGAIDEQALAFVREVRAAGRPVALTTNATDRLGADLAALGVAEEFDAVVNSFELGIRKPAREFYLAASAAVGVPPKECLVVDDEDRVIRGARVAGLPAYRWSGPADLPYLRAALDLGGPSRDGLGQP
jgi:putative hydrolase of the HAD superfamily